MQGKPGQDRIHSLDGVEQRPKVSLRPELYQSLSLTSAPARSLLQSPSETALPQGLLARGDPPDPGSLPAD